MKRNPRLEELVQLPTHGYDSSLSRADNIAVYKAQTHKNIRATFGVIAEHLNLETHREWLLKLIDLQTEYDRVQLTPEIERGLELIGEPPDGAPLTEPSSTDHSESVH